MNELHITAKDLKDGIYKHESIDFDGHLLIDANLGMMHINGDIKVTGRIMVEAGTHIKAGWGIEAGWGIKAGEGIITWFGNIIAQKIECLRVFAGFMLEEKKKIVGKVVIRNPSSRKGAKE